MRSAAVLLALAGCVPYVRGAEIPPRPSHAAILDVVIEEWRAGGFPWTPRCQSERERIAVALVDDAEMRRQVSYCAAESPVCVETRSAGTAEEIDLARARAGCGYAICSAGSVIRSHSEPWPAGLWAPWRVTIIVSRYQDEARQRSTIVHEYAHALSTCALGFADERHLDPAVWSSTGVVGRARRRALQ